MQDWVFRLGFQHTNETRNLKAVVNKIRLPLIASRQQISKAVWAEEYSARWSHFSYLLVPVIVEDPTLRVNLFWRHMSSTKLQLYEKT